MCELLGMSFTEPVSLEEKQLHALHLIRKSEHRVGVLELISSVGLRLEKADEVLQPLVDMGYINQDSRDQGGSVAPYSTYYTVIHKRNEIDRLINEDTEKVLLPATSINFIGAGKDDKVLACVRCWVFYKPGATFCRKCLHKTVEMGTSIVDIIVTLNQKGFKTEYCCCGDNSNGIPYVYFGIDVVGLNAPTNFAWGRGGAKNLLTMIPYHKARGIPRKKMVHLSEEVVEINRIKNIEVLRAWANGL